MKIRKSFFIRWLMTIDQNKQEISLIDVEHIQSGNKHRVSSLEEAKEWMKKSDFNCEEIQKPVNE